MMHESSSQIFYARGKILEKQQNQAPIHFKLLQRKL